MATRVPTIDSQVHAYERDRPERPWQGTLAGPDEVTGDDMVAAMDAVGVDGALLVSPYAMYRFDAGYAIEVHRKHPSRFGLIRPFDPESEAIDEQMAEWTATPGVVGARVMLSYGSYPGGSPGGESHSRRRRPGRGARERDVLGPTDPVPGTGPPQSRHPVGGRPPGPSAAVRAARPTGPVRATWPTCSRWRELDHVTIKISGACTLSHRPFPYPDIWEPLGRIFEAFGLARCMWGTDWTRAMNLLTYEQGVEAFRVTDRLSDSERAQLMGGTLAKIYRWSPGTAE